MAQMTTLICTLAVSNHTASTASISTLVFSDIVGVHDLEFVFSYTDTIVALWTPTKLRRN